MNSKRALLLAPVVAALVLVGLLLTQSLAAGAARDSLEAEIQPEESVAVAAVGSWNSGWVIIPAGTCETYSHNLGGDPSDYAVELWFLDTDDTFNLEMGMNRHGYGGIEAQNQSLGVYWERLAANTIDVCRGADDMTADRVRIRVWVPATGTGNSDRYASKWTDIDPGLANTLIFTHGLNAAATDLTVSLWFSGTQKGIHHYGYGGVVEGPGVNFHGAYWHNLTDSIVQVTRLNDDVYVEQVRVVVVHGDPPDYDSLVALGGWQPLQLAVPFTFTHGLNWNPNLLLVRAECLDATAGIHHLHAGGFYDPVLFWQGAYIRNLAPNTVAMLREPRDGSCREVRVRVWRRGARVYLPFVVRNL
jgi:hypothetical protein